MSAIDRVASRHGCAVEEVQDAIRKLVSKEDPADLAKILARGDMSPMGVVSLEDMSDFILPNGDMSPCRFAERGYVPSKVSPTGAHTGPKGVGRARVNGRSIRKAVR